MIETTDIVYVYSGGSSNADPTLSLGGDPSAVPVTDLINNLFANVSPEDAEAGLTDYTCFYIFNNSLADTLYNAKVYVQSQAAGGSDVRVGFFFADEIQKVTVTGAVTSGTLTLSHDGDNFVFSHSSTLSVWAANFQSAIRSISGLEDVTISATSALDQNNVPTTVFTVVYTGGAGNRAHPILDVVSNTLTPTAVVSVARNFGGSPINSITVLVDQASTTPSGIVFSSPTLGSPLLIGDLRPTDGIPVWLERTTAAGSEPVADDNIIIVCNGTAFP